MSDTNHGERLARIEVQVEKIEQDSQEIKGGLKEMAQAVQSLATQAMTQVAKLAGDVSDLEAEQRRSEERLRNIEDKETKRAGVYAVIAIVATFLASNWDKLLGALK